MREFFRNVTAARRRWLRLRMRTHGSTGATAVEFAFVAPIFFVLVFGMIEEGIIYLAQTTLQTAVNDAARTVRTGSAGGNSASFRNTICSEISVLMACDSNLQIDLVTYGNFSSASYGSPLNADGTLNTSLNHFQPGSSGSIELLRAVYSWQVVTPLLTPFLSNMANNNHLISATATFRNEPY